MYECDTCTREFKTFRSCEQHMNDKDHWAPVYECATCTREFVSLHSLQQHMSTLGHWPDAFSCDTCSMKFHTESAADSHMRAAGHFENYCQQCDRRFQNANNLRMHLNSNIHRGRNISCPFCATNFTTASGLSHHLESGSCPNAPQLNRETILAIIRKRDPNNTITNKQIGWHDEGTVTYEANDHAWNGFFWECYICHDEFNNLHGLNMHLNSPRHKGKVYHCPNKRGGCEKEFVSLAGLFGHLESETCSYMRFERVQQHVGSVLQGRQMISFPM